MGNVSRTVSTERRREQNFPGIIGYRPLPLPMSREQIQMLPNDVLVAEVRHYLTIVEQKQAWQRARTSMVGSKQKGRNASPQPANAKR